MVTKELNIIAEMGDIREKQLYNSQVPPGAGYWLMGKGAIAKMIRSVPAKTFNLWAPCFAFGYPSRLYGHPIQMSGNDNACVFVTRCFYCGGAAIWSDDLLCQQCGAPLPGMNRERN